MELEQVLLDLLDLRQLYCFMQVCFSGQQNSRIEFEQLGGRARLLLKSLLDDALLQRFSWLIPSLQIVETQPKLVVEAPERIVSGQTQSKSSPPRPADSGSSANPRKRNQCRACVRRGTMKRNPDVSDKQDGLHETETSSSLNSFVSCASTTHETTVHDLQCQSESEKQETAIDYSEDISNTIKKIESQILALKLRSRSRSRIHALKSSSPFWSDLLATPVGQVSENKPFAKVIPSQGLSPRSDFGCSESVTRASQLRGCEQEEVKRDAVVGRVESPSQSAKQASSPEFVHGFVVPSVSEDPGMKVGSYPSRYGSPSGRSRAKGDELRKHMPRQMIIRPTLMDHPTSKLKVLPTPIKNRTDRETQRNNQTVCNVSRKKMNFPSEEETEKSQSSSSASYSLSRASTASSSQSWTSQQSGVSGSDSRDYSSPRHYVGPKAKPTKRRKPDSHKGSEKRIGGLKRLKNKLGLILHHHHHHHHHHYNSGDGQLTWVNRRHSMWEHLGNLFHKAQKDRPLKKYNKSRVKEAPGHLHALLEGFMRHVWKSGRSKPSKGKIRGLTRQKKERKTVKKLRRWKLPNKAKLARLVI